MTKKAGLPPGSLVHVGKLSTKEFKINVVKYNEKKIIEASPKNIETALKAINNTSVTWINISGIHNAKVIETIGSKKNIHPLVLEDIMSARQRPKLEEYDNYLFLVLRMLYYSDKENFVNEQISFILGKNYVITFQETEGDIFENIRTRLNSKKGKIRKNGSDYLMYALIDTIVDNYFIVSDNFGESSEEIEDEMLKAKNEDIMENIFKLKNELSSLRKSVVPLRDILSKIQKDESNLITKNTKLYLRDVQDHTIQIMDTIETLRDRNSSLADIHLANMSNRMNEVMKVLTIISTIFIPITFITGLYGMNFKFMPEINSLYGYPVTIGAMLIIAVGMIFYFKKKKWL